MSSREPSVSNLHSSRADDGCVPLYMDAVHLISDSSACIAGTLLSELSLQTHFYHVFGRKRSPETTSTKGKALTQVFEILQAILTVPTLPTSLLRMEHSKYLESRD